MRLPITPTTTLMRELRTELRSLYPAGRLIVSVDGLDAARVSEFADLFSQIIGEDDSAVFHARLSDFHHSRQQQAQRGETVDEDALRRALVDPFRSGSLDSATSGFQLATWDSDRDAAVESRWVTAPSDAVLVLSGVGTLSPELRGMANWSLWLETAQEVLAKRPGRSAESPYSSSEFTYLRSANPAQAASAIVDNSDPNAPSHVFRDFC